MLLNCNGSNNEKNVPGIIVQKPIALSGSTEEVHSIFEEKIGDEYDNLRGEKVEFSMMNNSDGYIMEFSQILLIKDNKLLNS